MGMDPITIGLGASAVGGLWSAYEKNKQAKKNTQAVQQRNDTITNATNGMMWNGAPPGADMLTQLIGQMNNVPQINMGSDGIMQMIRGGNGNVDAALGQMMAGGNAFDPTSTFAGLAPRDTIAVNDAVSGLRGGFAGLGQRFGSAAMRQEGNMRARMAADVGARNAGIAQSAWENAQGRVLQAAGMSSQNQNNVIGQLLAARGQDIGVAQANADMTQRGQSMQLSAIGQIFNQILAQKQFNQGLLGMQAGMPVPQSNAPGWGGAISDIGQIGMYWPMLRGMMGNGAGGGGGGGQFGSGWVNPIQSTFLR